MILGILAGLQSHIQYARLMVISIMTLIYRVLTCQSENAGGSLGFFHGIWVLEVTSVMPQLPQTWQ